jgi:hypothetical protein
MSVAATLQHIGMQLSRNWHNYWKALRRNKSEEELWKVIDDTMILAGEWMREVLGYDEVVTDNEGNQYIIASHPFYKTLLLSGALQHCSLQPQVEPENRKGFIGGSAIEQLDKPRIPAKRTFSLEVIETEDESQRCEYIPPVEVTHATQENGTGTQAGGD